jgi:hypothetical protein
VALERLERVGANLVGAVANDVPGADRHLGHSGRGVWQYATSARRLEAAAASRRKWIRSGAEGGDGHDGHRGGGGGNGQPSGDGQPPGNGKDSWDERSLNFDAPGKDAFQALPSWDPPKPDALATSNAERRDEAP